MFGKSALICSVGQRGITKLNGIWTVNKWTGTLERKKEKFNKKEKKLKETYEG